MIGARLLDAQGKRRLDASGKRMLTNGHGDGCCCSLCAPCDTYPSGCQWCDQDDGNPNLASHSPSSLLMLITGVLPACLVFDPTLSHKVPALPGDFVESLDMDLDSYPGNCQWWKEQASALELNAYSDGTCTTLDSTSVPDPLLFRLRRTATRTEFLAGFSGLPADIFFYWEGPNPLKSCCKTITLSNQLTGLGDGLGVGGTVTLIPCGGL